MADTKAAPNHRVSFPPHAAVAVETAGLSKRFGRLQEVQSVSFSVERGEVFALLGPNGAGDNYSPDALHTDPAGRSGPHPGYAALADRRYDGPIWDFRPSSRMSAA